MKKFGVVVMIVGVLGIAGCGFFTKPSPEAMDVAVVQSMVNSAVGYEKQVHPEYVPVMLEVSNKLVQDVNTGTIVTMDQINTEISKAVAKYGMTSAAATAISEFITDMQPIMTAYVGQRGINVDVSKIPVQVCLFAQWVNNRLGGTAKCTKQLPASSTTPANL